LDKDAIVISIDDDIGYPRGFVNEMLDKMLLQKNRVVAASAPSIERFEITPDKIRSKSKGSNRVVEGWGGIAYRVSEIDTRRLKELSSLSSETRNSDDLVISMVLSEHNIDKIEINNQYLNKDLLVHFPYGFGNDALHDGAGLNGRLVSTRDQTPAKYRKAISDIADYTKSGLSVAQWKRKKKNEKYSWFTSSSVENDIQLRVMKELLKQKAKSENHPAPKHRARR
jgi:hypothetical protein